MEKLFNYQVIYKWCSFFFFFYVTFRMAGVSSETCNSLLKKNFKLAHKNVTDQTYLNKINNFYSINLQNFS